MLLAPDLLVLALCSGPAGAELGPINTINDPNTDKLYGNVIAAVTV